MCLICIGKIEGKSPFLADRGWDFCFMTEKELRAKMYKLVTDIVRKYDGKFNLEESVRKEIKAIMNEYKNLEISKPKKVEFYAKKESEWKPYPQTKF